MRSVKGSTYAVAFCESYQWTVSEELSELFFHGKEEAIFLKGHVEQAGNSLHNLTDDIVVFLF